MRKSTHKSTRIDIFVVAPSSDTIPKTFIGAVSMVRGFYIPGTDSDNKHHLRQVKLTGGDSYLEVNSML